MGYSQCASCKKGAESRWKAQGGLGLGRSFCISPSSLGWGLERPDTGPLQKIFDLLALKSSVFLMRFDSYFNVAECRHC